MGFEFKEGKKERLLSSNESLNKSLNEKENLFYFCEAQWGGWKELEKANSKEQM